MTMAPKLYVIALISGGKDSIFSILHCLANGHEVVALVNLYPSTRTSQQNGREGNKGNEVTPDDLNSYMYQTVGHTVIPLYEEVLGIPLYRQEILGGAINEDKSYAPVGDPHPGGHGDDETEALVPALTTAKRAHPEANAVSTGAILSDYQRTRVESVATRLDLIPLSFLWQYPSLPPGTQTSLLDDMAAVSLDARIIKVASGGLDDGFLWENVASPQGKRTLATAMSRFGEPHSGAMLGEGGEFETLAIEGPRPLWKKRIHVSRDNRVVVNQGAGSALLRITGASLAPLSKDVEASTAAADDLNVRQTGHLRIPDLLDADSMRMLQSGPDTKSDVDTIPDQLFSLSKDPLDLFPTWCSSNTHTAWHISNMVALETDLELEAQIQSITNRLRELLLSQGRSPDDVVYTTIILRSMASFAIINKIYATLFKKPNPPARITVTIGHALPRKVKVIMSVVVDLKPRHTRQSLHVQSRSYWAPANIGPYSQAILTRSGGPSPDSDGHTASVVYVAGQIPLEPASMELATPSTDHGILSKFRFQTTLALQHLWRIGRAMEVNYWAGGVAYITGSDSLKAKARTAGHLWRARNTTDSGDISEEGSEDEGVDLWEQKFGGTQHGMNTQATCQELPNLDMVDNPASATVTPLMWVVHVDELPRGSEIEWASVGLAHGRVRIREGSHDHAHFQLYTLPPGQSAMIHATISDGCEDEALDELLVDIQSLRLLNDYDSSGLGGFMAEHATLYTSRSLSSFKTLDSPMVVRSQGVWGPEGDRLAAAVIIRGQVILGSH